LPPAIKSNPFRIQATLKVGSKKQELKNLIRSGEEPQPKADDNVGFAAGCEAMAVPRR
jgi:hypothetical protein